MKKKKENFKIYFYIKYILIIYILNNKLKKKLYNIL